jgi:hypothetical protein
MKSSLFSVFVLLCALLVSAQPSQSDVRRIRFERNHSSTILRGNLRPYTNHIYRFHARQGQRMTVRVQSPANDIVFWVQSRRYVHGSSSLILGGIHRNGETDWSGELPLSGEYEIYVSNPPMSDHAVSRALYYEVELRIE